MNDRGARVIAGAAALAAALLLVITVANSRQWVGTTFPGFFVLPNGVIPSVSLPGWLDVPPAQLFYHQVTAVDGVLVSDADSVYAAARRESPGTRIRYTLRAGDDTSVVTVASRQFTRQDYALIFGVYLLNGLAFILIGAGVFALKPRAPASAGLLASGLCAGIVFITGVDLYGPYRFFWLYLLAKSLLPATFMHVALTFPRDRLGARRLPTLLAIYQPFVTLGLLCELCRSGGWWYGLLHDVTMAAMVIAGAAVIAAVAYELIASPSPLVRRRTQVVAVGTLVGVLLPTLLLVASGVLGGSVPVNGAALTAFVFPLAIGYAVLQRDLFEIDIFLRRTLSHTVVVVAISAAYFIALLLYGRVVPGSGWLNQSPALLAVLNLGLLFLIAPVRERVQRAVDRVFLRKPYDAERALASLSQAFGAVLTDDEIETQAMRVLDETVSPDRAAIFEPHGGIWVCRDPGVAADADAFILPPRLAVRLQEGDVVARYEWEDGSGRPLPAVWQVSRAELIVPIRSGSTTMAILVLGPKRSGQPYTVHDLSFLRTAANQLALALTNAAALRRLHDVNRSLERLNLHLEEQVRERTAAVQVANGELRRSLDELRQAYEQLERNHAGLLRADRLATLGRLTAGIAHEMNTPLSAVLNALKIIADVGAEYASSIDDPSVLPADHREIAAEIVATAEIASRWTRKAAAFIRSVKAHGREIDPATAQPFVLKDVVTDAETLLDHRLRAASVRIDYEEDPPSITLVGDPSRLGQVLINLITNAIDAYEDAGMIGGRIQISARRLSDQVGITVRDRAGGIRAEVLPHIFEELFTTKGPGRGTGLGLWVARNLIEEAFGGTLDVESTAGDGSCFFATIPLVRGEVSAAWRAGAPVGRHANAPAS